MSTPPTGPPSPPDRPYAPPSPSGPAPPSGERLPWEERGRLGLMEALVQTIRLLVTDPSNAFSRLRPDGDITSPILFGIILSFIGLLLSQIWNLLFSSTYRSIFRQFEGFEGIYAEPTIAGLVATLVLGPIFFVIGLFIGSGILHLCLMLVGATERSQNGFEGTLKVYAYAQVAWLSSAVPLLGGLVYLVWALILYVIGFSTVHQTTQGRALAAVLIPIGVCCLCLMLATVFFGAMLSAMFAGMAQGQ